MKVEDLPFPILLGRDAPSFSALHKTATAETDNPAEEEESLETDPEEIKATWAINLQFLQAQRDNPSLKAVTAWEREGKTTDSTQALPGNSATKGPWAPLGRTPGKARTLARVLEEFFWPRVSEDVKDFCCSCPQCQIATRRGPAKALLTPVPIISTPFEWIALDFIGPLP